MSLVAIVWLKAQFMTRDVAISRKGILVKAMERCFCLLAKAMHLRRDVCF